ncbi:ribonuclease H-like domain-containing protein, partial [Lentinula raphanica]
RKISFKIIHSTTILLPKWREQVAGTEFDGQILPRDVATRWNSTFDMLSAFIRMKEPVTMFLDRSSNKLAEYALDNEEWEAIEGLVSVLKILKDATLFFSTSSPSVTTIIPAMDLIDRSFASGIVDRQTLPAPVRHALLIGKRTLNKYYQLTDDSYIYRMAIILHPELKLEYFK